MRVTYQVQVENFADLPEMGMVLWTSSGPNKKICLRLEFFALLETRLKKSSSGLFIKICSTWKFDLIHFKWDFRIKFG